MGLRLGYAPAIGCFVRSRAIARVRVSAGVGLGVVRLDLGSESMFAATSVLTIKPGFKLGLEIGFHALGDVQG